MTTLLYGIDRDTPVAVDCGELSRTTWGQFIADNADGIRAGDVEPEDIAAALLRRPNRAYRGGGGACAKWTIRLRHGADAAPFEPGTKLVLRDRFPAEVIKPTKYHRDMGKDGRSFVTVRITNPDGSTVVDVVHCTSSYPAKVVDQ